MTKVRAKLYHMFKCNDCNFTSRISIREVEEFPDFTEYKTKCVNCGSYDIEHVHECEICYKISKLETVGNDKNEN